MEVLQIGVKELEINLQDFFSHQKNFSFKLPDFFSSSEKSIMTSDIFKTFFLCKILFLSLRIKLFREYILEAA